MLRNLVTFLLCLAFSAARPCAWDRDTLKAEAAGKMDLVHVITGRFERWPAKYYEVRLARVQRELRSAPDSEKLALYDDGAVALDRLHRSGEAIELIEKKRALLTRIDPSIKSQKDHWYRYYANVGTFWAHRWFAEGADRKKIDQMEQARDLIAKAIEINPDAHFGREKYQLYVMEWVINPLRWDGYDKERKRLPSGTPLTAENTLSLGEYIEERAQLSVGENRPAGAPPTEAERGLGGLIMLGAAWESVDVFEALTHVTELAGDTAVAVLARMRVEELNASGRKGLLFPKKFDFRSMNVNAQYVEEDYPRLRKNADEWARHRASFVEARLSAGKHPDTYADFWDGYTEVPPAEVADVPFKQRVNNWTASRSGMFVIVGGLCCAFPALGTIGIIWFIRRRRRLRSSN